MVDGIVDSSILIDLLRKNSDAVMWKTTVSNLRLYITPIIWMEIVQAASDKQKRQQILKFLKQFPIVHSMPSDNLWAMRQIARFSLGHGLHLSDALIASVAVRLNVPVYTLNVKHFTLLPSIQISTPY